MQAELGSRAPDCTLLDQDWRPVTLSTLFGSRPTVLAFFPAAFSPSSTREMLALRGSFSDLGPQGIQYCGISVDTPFALKAFAKELNLNFPLLSDFNKDAITVYGVFDADMRGLRGVAKRALFVVDKQAVLRYREVLEDADAAWNYAKLGQAIARLGP